MTDIKKEDIRQEVFDLYDDYAHNRINRRDFVQKLSVYAVGGLTVPTLLSFLMPDYKGSIEISADDQRIHSEYITYSSPKGGGTIKGLLCTPANMKKKPGCVLVVHENRGLNPYIEDVARRVAVAGFVALAPDALTPLGGYPGSDDEGRALQAQRNREEMLADFIAGFDYLKQAKKGNGRVGVVGFCFGGWIANMMAVRLPGLNAAVPFYGAQPPITEVSKIQAPLLIQYAELDTHVNEGWPEYEAALKEQQKSYTMYMHPKANHGFHNNTTPRYDKDAAELAWKRTIDFFNKELK